MPYTELIKKAFNTVRREPALWVLGIILALFGGGSSGGGGNGGNFNMGSGDFGNFDNMPNNPDFQAPAWFNAENLVPILLTVACVVIALSIVSLVVRSVALAGLIHGADRAATGEDVHWRDLWRAGWSSRGRRIIGLDLLIAIPVLLFVLVLAGLLFAFAVPVVRAVGTGADPGTAIAGGLAGVACLFGLIFVGTIGGWILSLIRNYAARSIVLEGRPVMEAFGRGWRLFRESLADTMVFSIMLGVIGIILGFILGLLLLVVVLVLGVPFFVFWASQEFALMTGLLLGIPVVLLIIILSSVLYGPVVAFFETAWTVTWRYLTTPRPAAEVELAA